MAGSEQTFTPSYGYGINITGAATTANAVVDLNGKRHTVCITNTGTDPVFIRTGDSTVVATAADYPVLGGSQITVSKDAIHTHIAVIAPAGAPVVYAIPGSGF